ncbi:hypothetical protein MUN78_06210 [Leucobacter allii]|uniref:Uncharacterized protein n=1 Tax=Leucobacter allii TaxID=2932247 RepID=A0ABY4FQ75_9MICO|nr:hypothetical protein [Leucobacter allii]UOQ58423.1 hypothetical protein MUN78_06210 [Leucobacter allii]UOR03003.1 hypothetical protein MUN77_06820 [Leucobacter allii]
MDSVRTPLGGAMRGVGSGDAPGPGARRPPGVADLPKESLVLDIVALMGVIVLFAILGLLGKAVEKL